MIGSPVIYVLSHEGPIKVTATQVRRGRVEQTITAISSGTVLARTDAMVAAEIMGTIKGVFCDEGSSVNEGDTLIELNHAELDAQIALAEANLRLGQSRLEQANLAADIYEDVAGTQVGQTTATLEQARNDYHRLKALSNQDAISQSQLDQAILALRVAEENSTAALAAQRETEIRNEEVRCAQCTIEQIEASLEVVRAAREKAFIRAPFPGIVARVFVDVGEAVAVGMPALHLVQAEDCYVKAPFDEANAAEIQVGQRARLNLDAYRGADFSGRVAFVSPVVSLNPDLSRTIDVDIEIEEGKERFIPGMSVDVMILVQEKDEVLFIPTEALIRERYAYVIEDGRAVRREVKIGVGNWNTTEILEGFKEGEQVVTSVGLRELEDGAKVQIVDALETL